MSSHRRLPMLDSAAAAPAPPEPPAFRERTGTPGRCVAFVDAQGQGRDVEAALAFMAALSRPCPWLCSALPDALPAGDPPAVFQPGEPLAQVPVGQLWVAVGGSFALHHRPWCSILVGASGGPLSWSAPLRPLRGTFDLELPESRPAALGELAARCEAVCSAS